MTSAPPILRPVGAPPESSTRQSRPAPGSSISRYLEIRALVAQAQAGDRAALDRLLVEYKRLLGMLAGKSARLAPTSAEYDDHLQVARLTLVRSVRCWDERRAGASGAKSFTTYLVRAVRSRLLLHRRLSAGIVHVPLNARGADGRRPSFGVAWLDAPAHDDKATPRLDLERSDADTEGEASDSESAQIVRAAFAGLDLRARDRHILEQRMLGDVSAVEIGARCGITSKRVDQIISQHRPAAVDAIRRAFEHRGLTLVRAMRRPAPARTRACCSVPVRQLGASLLACGLPMVARGMCRAHLARWDRGQRGADLERPIGPRGPRPGHAGQGRLDADQVESIRARLADLQQLGRLERGAAVRALAAEYSVHPESIRRIAAGDTWRKAA